jgi:hypothetical protein
MFANRTRRIKMSELGTWRRLAVLICFLGLLMLNACAVTGGGVHVGGPPEQEGGPPPHAPAHGYHAKHAYHYYPNAFVYFDVSSQVYFYLEGSVWKTAVVLPDAYRVKIVDIEYVSVELDDDKPYKHFEEHKKKYPPGHAKKKGKKK